MGDRWVLTDVGLVSAAGDSPADLFDRLLAAEPLGTRLGVCPDDPPSFPAAPIEGFRPRDYVDRRGLKCVSRSSQLACAAASRLSDGLSGVAANEIGVVYGSAWASLDSIVRFEWEAHVEGPRFVDPVLFTETVANVPAGQVSIFFGWSALNATVSSGTASGLEALIRAADFLEERRAKVIVAGGGDELNRRLLSTVHAGHCRDTMAESTVGGEGACLFAIESAEHAALRGAKILGRLGAGASCIVEDPGPGGAEARVGVLRELLRREELNPDEIDLVVLSGNGDPRRDLVESKTIGDLFENDFPAAIAPKVVQGETWGASGPLGVAIALEAMRRGTIPPGHRRGTLPGSARLEQAQQREMSCALILDCTPGSRFACQIVRTEA